MNKYQKALLHITPYVFTGNKEIDDRNLEYLAELQELVDMYEKELNLAIKEADREIFTATRCN